MNIDRPLAPTNKVRGHQARQEVHDMLQWALIFLVVALVAGVLGFTGVAGTAANIAWILFVVGLVVALVLFIMGRRPRM